MTAFQDVGRKRVAGSASILSPGLTGGTPCGFRPTLGFEGDGVDLYPRVVIHQPDGAVLDGALQLHGALRQFGQGLSGGGREVDDGGVVKPSIVAFTVPGSYPEIPDNWRIA